MNNCPSCDSTGLVLAARVADPRQNRYIFKCDCISAGRRAENFPIWRRPMPGFFVFDPCAIPEKPHAGRREESFRQPVNRPAVGPGLRLVPDLFSATAIAAARDEDLP